MITYYTLLLHSAVDAPDAVISHLPEPELNRDRVIVPPRTPIEGVVAGIWKEVLGVKQVGVFDNFFELGGHSLLATQVLSRIRRGLEVQVDLRMLLQGPTVAQLSSFVEQSLIENARQPQHETITAVNGADDLELSFAQRRLWLIEQMSPDDSNYTIASVMEIFGELNESALERALAETISRHEILRLRVEDVEGRPVPLVDNVPGGRLPLVDLIGIDESNKRDEGEKVVGELSRRRFDLRKGPLMRAVLIRLAEQQHALVVVMHHIISDGWSAEVFNTEVSRIYEAYSRGETLPLEPLPIQYTDYAAWQRKWLQGEGQQRLAYWKQQLAGAPPVLEIATDRPRPAVCSFRRAHQNVELGAKLSETLKQMCRAEGVTEYISLLAGFKAMLYRYSGQEDIVVGTPIAGRNRLETERLIGLFQNTLVLRTDLSGEPSYRELLRRVKEVVLEAQEHQEVPFEKLVEALEPDSSLSYSPLFQVMFVLLIMPQPKEGLKGLRLKQAGTRSGIANVDLKFALEETREGIRGQIEYNSDLYDARTISQMCEHYRKILWQMAQDLEQKVSTIEMLTDKERHQLLVEWNQTDREPNERRCLHQMVEQQAARTPEAVAVADEQNQLSYKELNARANQLARYLMEKGVGPEQRVAVMMARRVEMVIAILGVAKAGAAYVPLDPTYPHHRLAHMLEDSDSLLVLREQGVRQQLDTFETPVINLDEQWEQISRYSRSNPNLEMSVDNLAYIIYTSGSTGKPKGVMVTHTGLNNLANAQVESFGIKAEDRILQFSSLSFDASVFEMMMALTNGATLYLSDKERLMPGPDLVRILNEKQITVVTLPPSALAATPNERVTTLRSLVTAGEACSKDIVDRWAVGRKLYNAYGPTEATVWATGISCQTGEGKPTIGRPITNTRIYVLDKYLNPVPVGVPGELHLAGVGLARGYLNMAKLTAERFIPSLFSSQPGEKMYRTGDLVKYRADGKIEYLGRIDDQVKVRGYRIELGEIEELLKEYAAVKNAVVVVNDSGAGQQRLVGYVELREGEGWRPEQVREYLKERLPDYMVPAVILKVEEIAVTRNGKVDRSALPHPDDFRAEDDREIIAAQTPTEELLTGIWIEIFGLPQVSIDDDFFEMGGHSLLASQLISRIRETLQVELSISDLFKHPTVAKLADYIDSGGGQESGPEILSIRPAARGELIPPSFAQERVWFLAQLAPDSIAYNAQVTIRFKGFLNAEVLERVFTEIVSRHEIFRTSFSDIGGRLTQVIHPPPVINLPVFDLSYVEESRRESEAERLVTEELQRPFDVDKIPLVRWTLLRLKPDEHVLIQVEHHFVHDGWSFAVLLREVKELYQAFSKGEPSPLAPLPLQYADFAIWQRNWLQGEVLNAELAYWKETLAGALPVINLPTDYPRPKIQSFRGAAQRLELPPGLCDALRSLSRREGCTLFMTMYAAFLVLLHRYTGQHDLVLGSGVANRRLRKIESLIGMIVNTVPIRTELTENPTFRETLRRVREVALAAYAHQDVPFEKIVEALQLERDMSHNPLFQMMFSFHDSPVPDLEFAGLTGNILERHNGSAKFDLNIIVIPRAEQQVSRQADFDNRQVSILWEYSTDLFEEETIRKMTNHYVRLLHSAVDTPDTAISHLPLLSQDELKQLLLDYNRTSVDFPDRLSVTQMFKQVAARQPQSLALACAPSFLSYEQLDLRSSQIAACLQATGVTTETLVAVVMDRSIDLIVSLLAVLKAGGAYLPIDVTYPEQRISYMLEDSQAKVVLTHSRVADKLPQQQRARVLCIDRQWDEIAACGALAEPVTVDEQNLCYVIYTSGSTGKPKGVAVTHGGLVNLVMWHQSQCAISPHVRATQVAGVSFDASVLEIWPYLCAGASLHIPTEEVKSDPEKMVNWLRQQGITLGFLPTPLAEAVLAEPGVERLMLKAMLTGGDRLRKVANNGLGFKLLNYYGPTEATVVTSSGEVECGGECEAAPSIGEPIANTKTYILDRWMKIVPAFVAGEIYVGGEGLARGYLRRAEMTAERFVPDPYSEGVGARLYRTGDLGRWLRNGEIEFIGRIDDQVKVRGYRIELGEIEELLKEYAAVKNAVVVVNDSGAGQQRLIGYVELREGEAWRPEQVREYLKERLPDYMVPAVILKVEEIAVTRNGKVDRSALPHPDDFAPTEASETPSTPVEEILANIWSEVLGRESIGKNESFFEIGGHSLLATQIASRLRDAFSIELSLKSIFESPRLADLAASIEDLIKAAQGVLVPPIEPLTERTGLPLSFAQERLWFLNQLAPENIAYNIHVALRFTGKLDVDALGQSLNEIVRRHEILRTTFGIQEGRLVQIISPTMIVDLALADLTAMPETEREEAAHTLASKEARWIFDLATGPLMRTNLLRLGDEKHVLLLTMHHIISDGWSMGVLFKELETIYDAFSERLASPLSDLQVQYADYAFWQREWLQSGVLEAELAYWRRQLGGNLPDNFLPTDKPRPRVQSFRGAFQTLILPAELCDSLKSLSCREGCTLFMTLSAAFATLLYRSTGRSDIVVGTDIANRNQRQTEGLVGLFANQLVLRTDLSGNPGFRDLLKRVRTIGLEAYTHQDVPFEKLVDVLQTERDLSQNPLFQVMLIMQNAPISAPQLRDIKAEFMTVDRDTSVFDLSLSFTPLEQGQMRILSRYNSDLFAEHTITRLMKNLATLLQSVVEQPDARLNALRIISDSEAEQLAVERKQSKLKQLMKARPQAVKLAQDQFIKTSYVDPQRPLPLVIQPGVDGLDLAAWAMSNQDFVQRELNKHGAILFRHFNVGAIPQFEQFARALSPRLMEYGERSSPRTRVTDGIYTSTDYPADQEILLHNEQSYTINWPMKIWFFCLVPAQHGGHTPIADSRRILGRINPAVIETFRQKGVMYVRNYGHGMGLSWQEAFQTNDKSLIEKHCQDAAIEAHWRDEDHLTTRQVRPAIRKHPQTGEMIWFNHALFFHISSLEAAAGESIRAGLQDDELPFNTLYGDGSRIERAALDEIRNAYREEAISFTWEKGDILMIDNMLVAHGRESFQGDRKIVVAMAEPFAEIDRKEDSEELRLYAF